MIQERDAGNYGDGEKAGFSEVGGGWGEEGRDLRELQMGTMSRLLA